MEPIGMRPFSLAEYEDLLRMVLCLFSIHSMPIFASTSDATSVIPNCVASTSVFSSPRGSA